MKETLRRRCRGIALCISFFFFVSTPLFAAEAPGEGGQVTIYVESLLEKAKSLNLAEDRYWHILLHYRPHHFGIESFVDDPKFFLAPDGKTNPEDELEATIRAFFTPASGNETPAVCRFPARFEWLKDKLGIDPDRLPSGECKKLLSFMESIKPESCTLVFPMAHLNGPASMFGHTLLIIETANRSRLLAQAVTYSAYSHDTSGPLFAFKGLFGLYPGYFSVLPYYKKISQYSDVDHRDIWEYPLNLTKPEIRRMMLHIVELDSIASDYYFFDENCSYLLLFLLEAARPTLNLTGRVHGWLIPLDSIRMIQDQGLITGAVYRPSKTTKIRFLASRLPGSDQDEAIDFARGGRLPDVQNNGGIPEEERRETCDLSAEYLQYLYTKHLVQEKDYQQRYLGILKARSTLGTGETDYASLIPTPADPVDGHPSGRLSLGFGLRRNTGFEEVRVRPCYHDLMDSDDGYVEGAQLIFAELALRYSNTRHEASLEDLDIIDLMSLTPRDSFFHPVSWKIKTGFTRIPGDDDKDHLIYELNPGGGFTFGDERLGLMYMMLETGINAGSWLDHGWNAGIGGSAGILKTFPYSIKAHLFLRGMYYGLGDRFGDVQARAQASYAMGRRQAISLDAQNRRTDGCRVNEIKTLWNLYF